MKIDLTVLTRNIPLSFSNFNLLPFLGIVVTVAILMKFGIFPASFNLLNIIRTDSFKLVPITDFLNKVFEKPSGPLAFCAFKPFRTFSKSFIKNGSVFVFWALKIFNY